MSFRQLIQSRIGFISLLCFFLWETGGFNFFVKLFAVFRNSMNVIANVKKFFRFFVIDGKGGVGGGVYPRDTSKCGEGVLTSARLTDTRWGGRVWDSSEEAG